VFWYDNNGYRDIMGIPRLTDLSTKPWTGHDTEGKKVSAVWPTQYLCPDATWALQDHGGHNPIEGNASIEQTYGMNMFTQSKETSHIPWPSSPKSYAGTRPSWIKSPSSVIQFLDGLKRMNPFGGHDSRVYAEGDFAWYYGEDHNHTAWGSVYAWRHPNWSASIAYYDGHVESQPRTEVTADRENDSVIRAMWDSQMQHWTDW
jgi:prepilin-type processing-associated H-X9-DG protein